MFLFHDRVDNSEKVMGRFKSLVPIAVNSVMQSYFGFPAFLMFLPPHCYLEIDCMHTYLRLELCFRETQVKEESKFFF